MMPPLQLPCPKCHLLTTIPFVIAPKGSKVTTNLVCGRCSHQWQFTFVAK